MGGNTEKVQESKNTRTEPWAPAQPLLSGILGQLGGALDTTGLTPTQSSALGGLEANARAGNPWAPQIAGVARDLLAGGPDRSGLVSDAYGAYRSALEPTARGDYLDPNKNPFYSAVTSTIGDDITKRLAGMYAGAGRDPSGAAGFGTELGRSIASATAPVFSDQWNRERANQINAQAALYGAGNTTGGLLSQFDQTALANRQAGIGAAGLATEAANDPYNRLLAIEAQRRGIPLDALQRLAGMTVPIAGLGGSSVSNATTTKETQQDPTRLAVGGLLGGIGLLSGNPMMAMGGLQSAVGQPLSLDPRMYGGGYGGYAGSYYGNPAGRLPPIY